MGSNVDNNEYAKMFVTTATNTIDDNDLNGANTDYSVQGLKDIMSDRYGVEHGTGEIYVMGKTSKGFGFHRYTATTFPAHRGYLYLPSATTALNAIAISFSRVVTGIEGVESDCGVTMSKDSGEDVWYTLNGMRLQGKPGAAGVYINNGKKIAVK